MYTVNVWYYIRWNGSKKKCAASNILWFRFAATYKNVWLLWHDINMPWRQSARKLFHYIVWKCVKVISCKTCPFYEISGRNITCKFPENDKSANKTMWITYLNPFATYATSVGISKRHNFDLIDNIQVTLQTLWVHEYRGFGTQL